MSKWDFIKSQKKILQNSKQRHDFYTYSSPEPKKKKKTKQNVHTTDAT